MVSGFVLFVVKLFICIFISNKISFSFFSLSLSLSFAWMDDRFIFEWVRVLEGRLQWSQNERTKEREEGKICMIFYFICYFVIDLKNKKREFFFSFPYNMVLLGFIIIWIDFFYVIFLLLLLYGYCCKL